MPAASRFVLLRLAIARCVAHLPYLTRRQAPDPPRCPLSRCDARTHTDVPAFDASCAQSGDLIDGEVVGHDSIYLIQRSTASVPHSMSRETAMRRVTVFGDSHPNAARFPRSSAGEKEAPAVGEPEPQAMTDCAKAPAQGGEADGRRPGGSRPNRSIGEGSGWRGAYARGFAIILIRACHTS